MSLPAGYLEYGDDKAALLHFLKGRTRITALCPAARVTSKQVPADGDARYYITASSRGGTVHPELPERYPRLDLFVCAPQDYLAEALIGIVLSELCPFNPAPRGFVALGVAVKDVAQEGDVLESPHPINGWPCRIVTVRLTVKLGVVS